MAIKTAKKDSSSEKLRHINEALHIYITTTQNNPFNVELRNRFGEQDYYKFRQMVFRLGSEVSCYENLIPDAKAIVRNNSLMMAKVTLEEIEKMPIARYVRARFESTHMTPPLSGKHLPQETTMNATSMVKEETQHPAKDPAAFIKGVEISKEVFFEHIADKTVRSFKILKSSEDSIYDGKVYTFVQINSYLFELWLTPDDKGNYTSHSFVLYRNEGESAPDLAKCLKEKFLVQHDPIVEITPPYSNQPKGETMKEQSEQTQRQLAEHRKDVKVVEKITFIDSSELPPETVEGFEDPLVVTVARLRKMRFIVYSRNGAKYFHILGAGQSMTGLHNSVVNEKVLYWTISSDLKEELVILDTPEVDAVGWWVRKEDLLYHILPVYQKKDSLDPVLEAALRCASFQAIESYITWAENYSEYIYPDTQQTLKHLQGG